MSENASKAAANILGASEDPHYPKKDSLLKLAVGDFVSDLKLVQAWDKDLQAYKPPVPSYSCYFTEKIRSDDGSISTEYRQVPIPKTAAAFRSLSDHFAQLAQAAEGLELERSSSSVSDLDHAMSMLKAYKKK